MADNLPEPASRKESYLAKAAGMDVTIPEKPESRVEQYLEAIAESGGGGGGGTSYTAGDGITIADDTISVDTTTIQEKLTAGTGIDITNNTISATGGGGPTVVQAIGNSTTDVMSQNAVGKAIYDYVDSTKGYRPKIGDGAYVSGLKTMAVGDNAKANGMNSVALGGDTTAGHNGAIALGYGASTSSAGEMNIGTSSTTYGYNGTNYRLISGVHDPVNAHDAATKGYVDGLVGNIESALNAINNGGSD